MPCAAIDQRVCATRVIPEHTADATAVARRCLRAEEQSVWFQCDVQFISYHARLHPGPPLFGINLQYLVPVFTYIYDYTTAHHLTGKRRATCTRNQVNALLPCYMHQFPHVLLRFWIGHAIRYLPIHRGIGSVCDLVKVVGIEFHLDNHFEDSFAVILP